jgi:hypothetical protein
VEKDNKLFLEKYPHLTRGRGETVEVAQNRIKGSLKAINAMMQLIPQVAAPKRGSELEKLSSIFCLFHVDMTAA